MSNLEALKQDLGQHFDLTKMQFLHAFGDDSVTVRNEEAFSVLEHLHRQGQFDFLMDVCGADYPTREKRFEVVYHLFNTKTARRLRVKVPVGAEEPVQSVLPIWRGADWFEREAYDMFGLVFRGHPNLRRILTHHQFVGHPLRKDYEADQQQHCTVSMPIHFDNDGEQEGDVLDSRFVPINIGPSHPAMHGTDRKSVV